MTAVASTIADMLIETEGELASERDVNAALRANVAKRDDEIRASGKRVAMLEGQVAELRDRAEVAELRDRAEVAEALLRAVEARKPPPAPVMPTGEIRAAIAQAQAAVISAIPKPVEYSGIEAKRDGNGLVRAWQFVRKV